MVGTASSWPGRAGLIRAAARQIDWHALTPEEGQLLKMIIDRKRQEEEERRAGF